MKEFNFVIKNEFLEERDVELFFGEKDVENLQTLDKDSTLWDILVLAGIFPSKGQARKDPKFKDGTLHDGVTNFIVGKKKTRIFIFKPFKNL